MFLNKNPEEDLFCSLESVQALHASQADLCEKLIGLYGLEFVAVASCITYCKSGRVSDD